MTAPLKRLTNPIALACALLSAWSCDVRPTDTLPSVSSLQTLGALTAPDLVEASGLARSTLEPDVFWAQNDSGNDERVFAFDSTGRALGAIRIDGAKNRDWEAIAIGPCSTGSCLFVGDVGDNGAHHKAVRIYRVPEPHATDSVSPSATTLTFRYPDGPHDVESMWVAPDSAIYLLTKRPEKRADGSLRPIRLYRLSASAFSAHDSADSVVVAQLVDSLPIVPSPRDSRGWITDAALSDADSTGHRRLAVRSYQDVSVFNVDPSTWRPTTLVARCSLIALRNATGEGLTWLPDQRLMFDAEGAQSALHAARCP